MAPATDTLWQRLIGWFLHNRLVVFVLAMMLIAAGLYVSPFRSGQSDGFPADPIPVDAIPDIGENQQIVFTEWPGRSPRDIEDQITYPLTTALMGIPGVRTVRSTSAFGFSTIYVIFDDEVEFYWSRSRVLEKLSSLPPGTVPDGVSPTLGPDATALGQIFWYTLEGHDPDGNVVGGWDQDELRSIQDWQVRYALQAVDGVSEVASIGGFVREYQVDVDPDAMRAAGVTLPQVADAVRRANLDVGARTLELNGAEYVVRGLGFVEGVEDLESTVVVSREDTPIRVRDVARVNLGPALRRGALDDAGAPAVGGVVVARYLENPLDVIHQVKERIAEIEEGLPRRTLEDGTVSQVRIVPFYDRTTLIHETLDTLSTALLQQILITVVVVLVLLRNLRSSLLISAMLPLGVLGAFIAMKQAGVDANVMALGGIAIAIGTMVDIGIVFVENIHNRIQGTEPGDARIAAVRDATAEVAPAVLTSVLTTVVSFLPVFGLTDAELRLFAPLAYAKTFAMVAAFVLSTVLLPALALLVLRPEGPPGWLTRLLPAQEGGQDKRRTALVVAVIAVVAIWLTRSWMPLGRGAGLIPNLLFVGALIAAVLGSFRLFEQAYPRLLATLLEHKRTFLMAPTVVVVLGALAWSTLGREYMPPFDEGSYLYMPSTMPHASMRESLDMLSGMDAAIAAIPEVDRVVGKIGRAETPLDPAPLSMVETVITYKPEWGVDADGNEVRQWRDHIKGPGDIWQEIVDAATWPGATSAPVLQPINARIVMLQSGMRAPMGIKVHGPDLDTLEDFGLRLEEVLKSAPGLRPETVFADRVVGKPYLEIDIDREAIGRYGLRVVDVQDTLQVALGGMTLTRTVEGRERYPVRVRYMREDRDSVEALRDVLIPTPGGQQIPLQQLADVRYVKGPQMIRSEDTFLTSYVLFDKQPELAEVDAVLAAQQAIAQHIEAGHLQVPAGVSYTFAGSYENQLRSEQRLMILVPIALAFVFILLYLQFHRVASTAIIYSGVLVAVAGGFGLLWLYGVPGFLDVSLFGVSMQDLFHVGTVNMSVAVWVGVIALIGIATDDGVVMMTYLRQRFTAAPPATIEDVRARTLEAGTRRVRPCLMTTATTLLALLPVVTSQGRGADIMVPMALPMLGGMAIELMTLFVVPVLYCAMEERAVKRA